MVLEGLAEGDQVVTGPTGWSKLKEGDAVREKEEKASEGKADEKEKTGEAAGSEKS